MEPAGLNRLRAALQPGDCVKVAALDRLGRSLTEVLELLGWLREREASRSSASGSPSTGTAPRAGRCCTWLIFAEMERSLAHERTLAGLERVKATGDGWICREGTRGPAVRDPRGKRV